MQRRPSAPLIHDVGQPAKSCSIIHHNKGTERHPVELPLDHPKKFLMMSGIALSSACIVGLAYVAEKWATVSWTLIEKVASIELATNRPRSEIEENIMKALTDLASNTNFTSTLVMLIIFVVLAAGAAVSMYGYLSWNAEWNDKSNAGKGRGRKSAQQGDAPESAKDALVASRPTPAPAR